MSSPRIDPKSFTDANGKVNVAALQNAMAQDLEDSATEGFEMAGDINAHQNAGWFPDEYKQKPKT